MKKLLLAVLLSAATTIPAAALDSKALSNNLRKTLGLDSRVDIQVATFTSPSGFGNLSVVNATIQGAPYPVFMDPGGKKYIFGGIVGDTAVDPDKARQKTIKLTNVYSQGSPKAPVTIVEYSDLQCSYCRVANDLLKKELYKAYTKDQVRLVFKHFPLSNHSWAEPAAVASECAGQQKPAAFWDMNDYFFSNQPTTSSNTVRGQALEAAIRFKLNKATFEQCLDSSAALQKVRADKEEGMAVGVNATPSFFINGRSRRSLQNFDDIRVVVDEKLLESKK